MKEIRYRPHEVSINPSPSERKPRSGAELARRLGLSDEDVRLFGEKPAQIDEAELALKCGLSQEDIRRYGGKSVAQVLFEERHAADLRAGLERFVERGSPPPAKRGHYCSPEFADALDAAMLAAEYRLSEHDAALLCSGAS